MPSFPNTVFGWLAVDVDKPNTELVRLGIGGEKTLMWLIYFALFVGKRS